MTPKRKQPPTGPRKFAKCWKCGGRLTVEAEGATPDGLRVERVKRCVKCGTAHLETVEVKP